MITLKKIRDIIKKNEWYRQATDSYIWYIGDPEIGVTNELNTIGFYCTENIRFEGYYITNQLYNQSKSFYDYQKNKRVLIDDYITQFNKINSKINKLFDSIDRLNIHKLPYNKLLEKLNYLSSLNIEYWENNFLCDKFDPFGDRFIKHDLKKSHITLQKDELDVLTCSKKLNFIEKCELDLLKIASNLNNKKSQNNKYLRNQINFLIKNYYFVENSWAEVKILDKAYFIDRIYKLRIDSKQSLKKRIIQLSTKEIKLKETVKMIIKNKKPDNKLQNSLYLFERLSELRDERKEYVLKFNYYLNLFLRPISKKLKIPYNLLYFGLPSEIEKIDDLKKYKKELKKRRLARCHVGLGKNHYFYSGREAKRLIELIHSEFTDKIKKINGNCASPGKVKGIARVIMGESHFTKFKKGDILIAPMTRPEYASLMKKAKAIITDEGGITCHAAIISRELKKPCVIGTQVATKKLIDGQLIEVDADKGVIKILEK